MYIGSVIIELCYIFVYFCCYGIQTHCNAMAMREIKIKHPSLQDGHVQIAALHQGGLAWPCPAWLLPGAATQHHTASQTHLDQTDAAASTSGSSAATSSEPDAEQLAGSSSNCSSSDDDASFNSATVSNASVPQTVVAQCAPANLLPAAAAAAVAHTDAGPKKPSSTSAQATSDYVSRNHSGLASSSEDGDDDSSCGDSDCQSSAESDSSSDMVNDQHDSGCRTDTQTAVQGTGPQQQTAFDRLDVLFSRKGAAGSMSTHLAALDLLKQKPGQSMHSAAQSAGGKSQNGLLCKAPASLQARKGSAKAGRVLTKQGLLAGEDGGNAIPKTDWVQMQNGGNPLYSNQKAGSASASEF